MPLLAGINRQQYEKIEKGGNPSLVTLDKISEGLDAELMLIPKEKMGAVRRILATQDSPSLHHSVKSSVGEGNVSQKGFSPEENLAVHDDEKIVDPWTLIEGDRDK